MRRIRSGVLRRAGRMRSSLSSSSSSCRTSSRNFGSSCLADRPSWSLFCSSESFFSCRSIIVAHRLQRAPEADREQQQSDERGPPPRPKYQGLPSSPVLSATGPPPYPVVAGFTGAFGDFAFGTAVGVPAAAPAVPGLPCPANEKLRLITNL